MENGAIEVDVSSTNVVQSAVGRWYYPSFEFICAFGKSAATQKCIVLDSWVVVPTEPELLVRNELLLSCLEESVWFYGWVEIGTKGSQLLLFQIES